MAALTPEQREMIRQGRTSAEGATPSAQGIGFEADVGNGGVRPSSGNTLPAGSGAGGPNRGWDPRTARSGIAANTSYQDQMRARQQALIDRLHGIATGQTKSPAQELFEQQVGQAQNQNVGTSASLRDVGPGGQRQIAAQNAEMIQGQGIEQGGILQLQQKQQAEQAMAQLYQQQRQGDVNAAGIMSEQELLNRRLDDSRNLSEIERLYGVDVRNTGQQQQAANTALGVGLEDEQSSLAKIGGAIQGGAAAFGYLNRVGGGKTTGAAPEDMNKPSYGWGGPGA